MTATPQDVQAKIDAAKAALAKTTATYPAMVKKYGPDPATWPAASQWHIAFADLDAARSEAGQLVAPPAPTPTPTPTASGSGLALVAYGGTLPKMTHLDAYDVVVADWANAPLLATLREGYAYTVTTAGVSPTSGYVILDPTGGKSGMVSALTPDEYVAKCAALKAANPKLHGIFLDNCEAQAALLPNCDAATFLAAIQHVSAGLAAHGLAWMANCGGYIAGDPGSNLGTIWPAWAKEIGPYFSRLLCENWQQATVSAVVRKRLRGTAWYQQWDAWQKCVGAVPGKFVGLSYIVADSSFGVYGRASMLVADGADPRNCFCARVGTLQGPDPYGAPWQKTPAAPKIDPVAGTASL